MKRKILAVTFVLGLMLALNSQAQTTKTLSRETAAMLAQYNQGILGANTLVFDPSMDMNQVQRLIDSLYIGLTFPAYEFSSARYALLFKPGHYKLDVRVGYYTHVIGLGSTPSEVVIEGAVRSNMSNEKDGHVLCNFWRSMENLTIVPTSADRTNVWAVSQAAPLRKVHVKGNLKLWEGASSGGFMANCKVDGTVESGSQQQWLSRNTEWGKWEGAVWNMMFMGVENAPEGEWPQPPYTRIAATPEVREKPFLTYGSKGFDVQVPGLKKDSKGTDWEGKQAGAPRQIPLADFYVAQAGKDNAQSMNKALAQGKHLLLTPGIYQLDHALKVTRPHTVVMGIGYATLLPTAGNMALDVADVEGVTIASVLVDANLPASQTLMQIGEANSKNMYVKKPTFLFDVFFRVGGPHEGVADHCLVINSHHVYVDHAWIWRADHGAGVAWDKNRSKNGLIVNGDNVTCYGLMNEHFQEYQTLWNGERGRVYFYQSEMPYDPPTPEAWKHGNTYGYASYKVADKVKTHEAWGVGIYNVFFDAPIIVDQAIETPEAVEQGFHHLVTFWLNGNKESVVKSIINGKGGQVDSENRKRTMK